MGQYRNTTLAANNYKKWPEPEKKLQQQTYVNPINLSSWKQESDFLEIKNKLLFFPLRNKKP